MPLIWWLVKQTQVCPYCKTEYLSAKDWSKWYTNHLIEYQGEQKYSVRYMLYDLIGIGQYLDCVVFTQSCTYDKITYSSIHTHKHTNECRYNWWNLSKLYELYQCWVFGYAIILWLWKMLILVGGSWMKSVQTSLYISMYFSENNDFKAQI